MDLSGKIRTSSLFISSKLFVYFLFLQVCFSISVPSNTIEEEVEHTSRPLNRNQFNQASTSRLTSFEATNYPFPFSPTASKILQESHSPQEALTQTNRNQNFQESEKENSSPTISILTPEPDFTFHQGQVLEFSGLATDLEDGNLSDEIQWASHLEGILGIGTEFSKILSTIGLHKITAMVMDSYGSASSMSIEIMVRKRSTGDLHNFSNSGSGTINDNDYFLSTPHDRTMINIDAGLNQSVYAANKVYLEGSFSMNNDEQEISVEWSFISVPPNSVTQIAKSNTLKPEFIPDQIGVFVVEFLVYDSNKNTFSDTVMIEVRDSNLSLTVPDDLEVECDKNENNFAGRTAFAIDECPMDDPIFNFVDRIDCQDCVKEKIITRTWTATNACAGSVSADQLIRVVDTKSPILSCPDDFTTESTEKTGRTVTFNHPQVIDQCDPNPSIICTPSSTSKFPLGTTEVTCETFDAAGNSDSCSFMVTIHDNEAPVISCPQDVTVADTNSLNPNFTGVAAATDNVDSSPHVDYIDSVEKLNTIHQGVTRTWTAVDTAGNETQCKQKITIEETNTQLNLKFSSEALQFPKNFHAEVGIQAIADGIPVPVPGDGVKIDLVVDDLSCVSIPSSIFIPGGEETMNIQVSYGGTATLPCSTFVTSSTANHSSEKITVTVEPPPRILFADLPEEISLDSQTMDAEIQLEVSSTKGVMVSIESSDPEVLSLSTKDHTLKGRSIKKFLHPGSTLGKFKITRESLKGSATLIARADGYEAAIEVIAIERPKIILEPQIITVGAGLQSNQGETKPLRVALKNPSHSRTEVILTVDDPELALISPGSTTEGSKQIRFELEEGIRTTPSFFVQGVEGKIGSTLLTATAPGFRESNQVRINVVQPAVELSGILPIMDNLDNDDPFVVRLGIPNASNSRISKFQQARAGGGGIMATVMTSNHNTGLLKTSQGRDQIANVLISEGQFQSSGILESGGIAFDPDSPGTTTLSVSARNFISTNLAVAMTTVTKSHTKVSAKEITVGSGLQITNESMQVFLSAPNHGGVQVMITSSDPSLVLVSPSAGTAGTASFTTFVPNQRKLVTDTLYIQGLKNATGQAIVTISSPQFTSDRIRVKVVRPSIEIVDFSKNLSCLQTEDLLRVQVGLPHSDLSAVGLPLAARTGGEGITVMLSTSNSRVSRLETLGGIADAVPVLIPPGESSSRKTVATGGVVHRPLAKGVTTLSASVQDSNFIETKRATRKVKISAPDIKLTSNEINIGSGLAISRPITGSLGEIDHGGTTVLIESLNPSMVLVAPNESIDGTISITQFIPSGDSDFHFRIHAKENILGTTAIQISAPKFSSNQMIANVVPSVIRIVGLPSRVQTLDPIKTFQIQIGVPLPLDSMPFSPQSIRPGGVALMVEVLNSNRSIGKLHAAGRSGNPVTVEIPVGNNASPSTIGDGSVAFEPLSRGATTISASLVGQFIRADCKKEVSITLPSIRANDGLPITVGGDLQDVVEVTLDSPAPPGLIVKIESSNGSQVLVAPNLTSYGQSSLELAVPENLVNFSFVIQGIPSQNLPAKVPIRISANDYIGTILTVNIVRPGLRIDKLNLTQNANSPLDPFQVLVGIPSENNSTISLPQRVRYGSGGLTFSVTSSDGSVGILESADSNSTQIKVKIDENSRASQPQRATLRIVGEGTTDLVAFRKGFVTTHSAQKRVKVLPK